jgi:hypothetical protein
LKYFKLIRIVFYIKYPTTREEINPHADNPILSSWTPCQRFEGRLSSHGSLMDIPLYVETIGYETVADIMA